MPMIVSIFDCDGTLYSAQFGRGLLEYTGSIGLKRRVRAYYAALLPRYLLRKLRLISQEAFSRPLIANLSRLIAGLDLEMGAAAFHWVAYEYLLPTRRNEVLSRLKSHQANQHLVVLLSGVYLPCLELIGDEFDVTALIGTQVEVRDGMYTGAIVPPVVTGRDKLPLVQDFLSTCDADVDWEASYAYADSIHDRQILEAVGNPVAVHPDPELRTLAGQRGWEVIGAG